MKTKELDLAYKLRHALDESSNDLPQNICERLASARNLALSHKKAESTAAVLVPHAALAGHPAPSTHKRFAWVARMGMAVPLAVLVFGLMGIYQFEQRQQIIESAAIDAAVLTDDLPISAYLDSGFNAFLAKAED